MTYSAQALAQDFQLELDKFFEGLDELYREHDAPDAEILSLLELRTTDLANQYRAWIG